MSVWLYMKFQVLIDYFVSLYTATEFKIIVIAGTLWAIFGNMVGGIDEPIMALMGFVMLDFATGIAAGFKTKTLSSRYGMSGIIKKATMFGVVAFCFYLDVAMNTHMLRGMAISGFAINEAMSVLENIDRLGLGWAIPDFIRSRLVQIRNEKGVH